jgi:glycosyltransferase involved in cell wall biosynthesis
MNLLMDKPSETKRVILCTPVLLLGGTEIQMLTLVRTLITGGHKVAACCYYEFDEYVVDQFKDVGAQVFLLKIDRSNGYFGVKKTCELMRKLVHCFGEYKPDIVHVQYLAPGLLPIIAARVAGVTTVFATVHIAGSIAYGWKAKFLLRIGAQLCTTFFCVSKGVEEFWFGKSKVFNPEHIQYRRKHYTIYNAIDAEKIWEVVGGVDRERVKEGLGIAGRPVIGIVGRLAVQKGHTVLLDAVKEVVTKNHDVILVIIGDGPDRDSLKLKAQSLGIEKSILWFGTMMQEEMFKLYGIMDVFVMPSLYEGFGLTAIEAMAAGLPVVGTEVAGLSEIIENGVTGYLVSVGDSQELSRCLNYLITNPDQAQRMGQHGKHRVRRLFSIDHFTNSMLFLYQSQSKMKTGNSCAKN